MSKLIKVYSLKVFNLCEKSSCHQVRLDGLVAKGMGDGSRLPGCVSWLHTLGPP